MLENPLSQFGTYNYRWSLGVLSANQVTNPALYSNGPALKIIQSGGFPDKTVTTAIEDATGTNVEFFIENVQSKYAVTHNPGTGHSNAYSLTFEVKEPHSVGLFFQSLSVAVEDLYGAGTSYLNVPFMLSCQFVGFDDSNNPISMPAHHFAFKFINVTFSVDSAGATYQRSAFPWNHQALIDQAQKVPTDLTVTGATVDEVLGFGERSVETILNKSIIEREGREPGFVGHRYRIELPKDVSVSGGGSRNFINPGSNLDDRLRQEALANAQAAVFETNDLYAQAVQTKNAKITALENSIMGPSDFASVSTQISQLNAKPINVQSVKAEAVINTNANLIGQSLILTDFDDYGNIPFQSFDETNIRERPDGTKVVTRGTMAIDPNKREFMFGAQTKIEKIIEQVILSSQWGKDLLIGAKQGSGPHTDKVAWFKIHTEVHIRDTSMIAKTGLPAMTYVYKVTPYDIHISRLTGTHASSNYSNVAKEAVKHYYYTYTGLNSEVIDFQFNIDNAFYKEISAIGTQGAREVQQFGGSETQIDEYHAAAFGHQMSNPTASGENVLGASREGFGTSNSGGMGTESSKKRVADHFNKMVLNSDHDNVTVDLNIWGDPFYLSDTDFGNNFPTGQSIGVQSDGRIDFTRGEVYVLIAFRSGLDYVGNLSRLDPVNLFTGVYRVIEFTNNFNNGMFTQTLHLARMGNQSLEDINFVSQLTQASVTNNSNLVNVLQNQVTGTIQDTALALQQTQDQINALQTAFQTNGVNNIQELFQGNAVVDLAQNVFGALQQINVITNNLNNQLGSIIGQFGAVGNDLGQQFGAVGKSAGQLFSKITGFKGK